MSSNCAFKVGDVLALRSDGFPMTVENIEDERVHCVWSGNEQMRRDSFDHRCLMKWSDLRADFNLLIPGMNITEEEAAALSKNGVGHA